MKLQFYTTDLQYLLDIGTIEDMYVATLESGVQVLRVTCQEKKRDEYQTVKVKKPKGTRAVPLHEAPRQQAPAASMSTDAGKVFSVPDKLISLSKNFMKNKNPPEWMR